MQTSRRSEDSLSQGDKRSSKEKEGIEDDRGGSYGGEGGDWRQRGFELVRGQELEAGC